jgi:hypothetical protein
MKKLLFALLLPLTACAGGNGPYPPNGGGITSNSPAALNFTNNANKFVGSFTVPESETLQVFGTTAPAATNGLWHYYKTGESLGGLPDVSYIFTNAVDVNYIIYDVNVGRPWFYSTSQDSIGLLYGVSAGSSFNWEFGNGTPQDFKVKYLGSFINHFFSKTPVNGMRSLTLNSSSGGIVDNSADGYTGKHASITGNLLLNGALYDSTGSAGASGDVPTSTGSGWSWQTPSGSFPLVGPNGYIYLADDGTTASSVAGYFQVKDNGNGNSAFPTSGAGLEMTSAGGIVYFQAYDRDSSNFLPFSIQAASITFTSIGADIVFGTTGGGKLVLVNSSGDLEFNNGTCGFSKANNRVFQKTPNGTKVYLHLTDPVLGASTATWTTTP